MPKKKDKNEVNKKLKDLLNELSQKEDLTEEDTDRLNELFNEMLYRQHGNKYVYMFKAIMLKIIVMFLISSLAIAPFIPSMSLNKNYTFLISAIVAIVFSLLDIFAQNSKKGYLPYLLVVVLLIVFACLLNNEIQIFNSFAIWIPYLIMVIVFYNFFALFVLRRKIKTLF